MLDAKGPGCVVRIWVGGMVKEGVVRFYLDNSETPAIEGEVYDIIGGPGLIDEPFSAVRSRGHNLYLPIPYARHCKVTFDGPNFWQTNDGNHRFWYNINYRTYGPNTVVQTFESRDLKAARKQLEHVRSCLLHPEDSLNVRELRKAAMEGKVSPNRVLERTIRGPGAVRNISLQVEAKDLPQALRSVVLVLTFDGKRTVWCPLGDFFGSGFGLNPFRGWWRTVEKSGRLSCRWIMPFAESCRVGIYNYGQQTVVIRDAQILYSPWKWDDRSLYFHSTWRQQQDIAVKARQGQDFNYVTIRGKGTYVGDTLSLHNGASAWWGEGDEKILVDGELFPSHFGTGTEDYYGYSYGHPAFFEAPFHAQPRGKGNNSVGYSTNTRTRSLDGIPFKDSLCVEMELWHWASTKLTCAVTTYWYATRDSTCNVFSDIAGVSASIDPNVSQ